MIQIPGTRDLAEADRLVADRITETNEVAR